METHTYYEDFSKIKGWLENKEYKVFYTAKSQKEYYDSIKEEKIKEIKQNTRLTQWEKDLQINKWMANTMLYSTKYAGGVIVMVKTHLRGYFTESMLIPENRGISLHSPCFIGNHNTYLHFIYGPPNYRKAEEFWKKTRANLRVKNKEGNTHYIIGDLNIHMNKDLDTNAGNNQRKPK